MNPRNRWSYKQPIALGIALVLAACSSGIGSSPPAAVSTPIPIEGSRLTQDIVTVVSGLKLPSNVASDSRGDAYVSTNDGLMKVTPDGTVTKFANSPSSGIAVDAAGNVYVVGLDRLIKYAPDGRIIALLGEPGEFSVPYRLAIRPGDNDIYVYDRGDKTIRIVSSDGKFRGTPITDVFIQGMVFESPIIISATEGGDIVKINALGGLISRTKLDFYAPGIAVDPAGNTFLSDENAGVVWKIAPDGTKTSLGFGLSQPKGLAWAPGGDLYVVDYGHGALKKILKDGRLSIVGTGFDRPSGVTADASGNVYVADTFHNAVKKVDSAGAITTIGSGWDIPAGVAIDSLGNLYVANSHKNAVVKVAPNGSTTTYATGFLRPIGLAVDGARNVYVADSGHNAIKKISVNGTVSTVGSHFLLPVGVAVDGAGNVYVADYGNAAIEKVSPSGTIATLRKTFPDDPTDVALDLAGHVYFTTQNPKQLDGGVFELLANGEIEALGTGYNGPMALAAGGREGFLYIADTQNNLIKRIVP
jgi:large repetitive protein